MKLELVLYLIRRMPCTKFQLNMSKGMGGKKSEKPQLGYMDGQTESKRRDTSGETGRGLRKRQ